MIFLASGLLVAVTLAAYHRTFGVPFVFDDQPAVLDNPTIQHLGSAWFPAPDSGLPESGRPAMNFSLALNYALGGTAVQGYHAVNLLIHVLAGLTLFGLVRRTLLQPILRERFGGAALGLGLMVAAIWLVHPLQTESVTYVAQRAESLMGLCYLLTLYFFIRGTEPEGSTGRSPTGPGPSTPRGVARPERRAKTGVEWYALALAACLLGMASKEVMVSAPLLVLIYDRTFVAGNFREALRRRRWFYSGLAATWLLLAVLVASTGNRGGTAGFGGSVTTGAYALTQFKAIGHYLRLAAWPHPLVFDYGTELVPGPAAVWPQIGLVLALLAATAIALWRRPVLGFLGVWFFAILAPSSSIVPIATQTMAEHRMYLPLAAVVALGVIGAYGWFGRRSLIVAAGIAVVLWVLTVQRNEDYRSALSIWSDTVAKRPGNARAQLNLGYELAQAGRPDEAIAHYVEALRLRPDYAEAHYNWGNVLFATRQLAEAINHYEAALRLNPALPEIHYNLGNALVEVGRAAEAMSHYAEALRLKPDHARAHFNYGNALATAGRIPEAITHYEAALRLIPASAEIQDNLGSALTQAGRPAEALPHYREALRLEPGNAETHNNFANALFQAGRTGEAIAEYEAALRLKPDYAEARNNLNLVLQQAPAPKR
jgi:protein O-mannosyl-transferase